MRRISRSLAINVCVEFEIDSASVAAAIQPVKQSDGTIDEQALTEYDAFITQAEMYLEDAGLEIIDFDDSNASATSRYYTLADTEAHRNGTSKYVIFLCISDHVPKLRAEQYQRIKRRWRGTAATLGVKYKVRKITVNSATFYDYDSACDEILRLATDWQKLLHS